MDDPFSIESVTLGAQPVGEHVLYLPNATYPIHIRGLGGRGLGAARQLRDELTRAIELEEAHRQQLLTEALAIRTQMRGEAR